MTLKKNQEHSQCITQGWSRTKDMDTSEINMLEFYERLKDKTLDI